MVKTANNFAAGFFGVPEYLEQVNIELDLETPGFNTSGAPYGICTNGNNAPYATNGGVAGTIFLQNNYNDTIARLNSQVSGIKFDYLDIFGMIQICTFETVQLGYSKFCHLFTEEDFKNFDYYWDVSTRRPDKEPADPISSIIGTDSDLDLPSQQPWVSACSKSSTRDSRKRPSPLGIHRSTSLWIPIPFTSRSINRFMRMQHTNPSSLGS